MKEEEKEEEKKEEKNKCEDQGQVGKNGDE